MTRREFVQAPGEEGVRLGGEPEERIEPDERALQVGDIAVLLQIFLERGRFGQVFLKVEVDVEVVPLSHPVKFPDIDLRSGDDAEAFQVRRERCPLRCTGRGSP